VALIAVGVVSTFGCGKRENVTEVGTQAHPLIGIWTTVDGDIRFTLTLAADQSLFMVETVSDGGQRSFPGTWEVNGETLTLRGVYFEPNGESIVLYVLVGESLKLSDKGGADSVWTRLE
jgi:hypothetical protein